MPSNKPKACYAKVFICKCKSHCTTLNSSTGRYEGEGERVPQSIQDRHFRDNHVLTTCKLPQPVNAMPLGHAAESATSMQSIPIMWHSFAQTSIIPSVADYEASQNWIDLLEWEVDNHYRHPVTSPTILLVFINNPLLQGKYIPPALHELAWPNLDCFCEILSLLFNTFSQENQDLQEWLYQELSHMSHEKEIDWAQQQVNLDQERIIVNTGKSLNSSIIWLSWSNNVIQRSTSIHLVLLIWQQGLCQSHPSLWQGFFFSPRRALRLQLGGSRDLLRVHGAPEDIINKVPNILPQSSTNSAPILSFINLFAAWSAIASIHTSLGI